MHKNGFTLIELIVVVSILGILSITALPRFFDISNEALVTKLNSMKNNLESATYRVYAKALLAEKITGTQTITIDGDMITINSGYPIGNWDGTVRHILNFSLIGNSANNCPYDWCGRGNARTLPGGLTSSNGRGVKVTPFGYNHMDLCGVNYMNHYDGTFPQIEVLTSEC